MSAALTHRGLPDGIGRLGLLSLVENLGKHGTGLSCTAVRLLGHYIWRSRDDDYLSGRICAVWERVSRTADDLALSSRAINHAERELETKGFVVRTTGGNGSRSGLRTDSIIRWAAGINLAPLIERYAELKAARETRCLQQQAIAECKAEIRRLRRLIREGGDIGQFAQAEVILPDGRVAPISRLDRLEAIRAGLELVLADIGDRCRATETSDGSEEIDQRIIQDQDSSQSCRPKPPAPAITPTAALGLASADYRAVVQSLGQPNWLNLIEASRMAALGLGIGQRDWGQACKAMGRERAALCILAIDRNARLRAGHRYRAEHPGKCLSGMIRCAASGEFNLHGLLLAHRRDEDSPPAIPSVQPEERPSLAGLTAGPLSRTISLMDALP